MIERAELGQLRKKHFASTIPTPGTLLSRSSFSLKVGLHSMVSSRSWSVRGDLAKNYRAYSWSYAGRKSRYAGY